MKVAIMQPYFMPYAGYFRLFAAADVFVALDCVQFPRRGWVHRNRFTDQNGELQWLTVPLKKGDRDTTRICDLKFQDNAKMVLLEETRRFPTLRHIDETHRDLAELFFDLGNDPTDYLITTLTKMARMLGLKRPVMRSSILNIEPRFKAQQRIIEIAKQVGATCYINAPGGKHLYDEATFKRAGLTLDFLPDYRGRFNSILERVIEDGIDLVSEEIEQNLLM
ncbi:WbqC family protein [Nitrosospira multiformis]|uniref:WbqC-like protein family protein n=1 Tax=Nitrosospira multiformis TaxID=1231 RepID=A0A1I7I7J5_9PROT|nr:WbqC family protein [Nitrosospira multiformis]SFU68942.1 WbqC-like protein family protein [Nitrosospira multiformis]